MYKIVGADQKEYGPVSEEQVRQWIAEGRANAQTIVRFQEGPWKPLSTFPEFAAALGIDPSAPPPSSLSSPPSSSGSGIPPLSSSGAMPGVLPPTNGMAIAGLACSILGVSCGLCCGPLFCTLGLIFSVIGLTQITQNPAKYSGRGLAIAGIVLGLMGYAVLALLYSKGAYRGLRRRIRRNF